MKWAGYLTRIRIGDDRLPKQLFYRQLPQSKSKPKDVLWMLLKTILKLLVLTLRIGKCQQKIDEV